MKPNDKAYISQVDPFSMGNPGFYGSPYPGIGSPFGGSSPYLPSVANPQVPGAFPSPGASAGGAAGGAAGGLTFGQLKGIVDKMGGINGIIGTMTRVQKMVQSFQQVAPMIKLLMGSFAKASTARAGNNPKWSKKSSKRKRRSGKVKYRRRGTGVSAKSRTIKAAKRK